MDGVATKERKEVDGRRIASSALLGTVTPQECVSVLSSSCTCICHGKCATGNEEREGVLRGENSNTSSLFKNICT